MPKFNNQEYNSLITDLLNDAIYLEGRSNRGTISLIRQYAEVVVRKILDLPPATGVTLGNSKIKSALIKCSKNSQLLMGAIENVRLMGNKCTHTQVLDPVTDEDVKHAFDSLFDIYAYLFVDFFTEFKFGRNGKIASSFSILPPIIRYIVLKNLYELDQTNIFLIDKYALAILKAFDENEAKIWLLQRKDQLEQTLSITNEAIDEHKKMFGPAMTKILVNNAPNMFDCCMKRIEEVAFTIAKKGKLYSDFESAMSLYKEKGFVDDGTAEAEKFNSLMEFVYLGRKPRQNDRLDDKDSYLTMR